MTRLIIIFPTLLFLSACHSHVNLHEKIAECKQKVSENTRTYVMTRNGECIEYTSPQYSKQVIARSKPSVRNEYVLKKREIKPSSKKQVPIAEVKKATPVKKVSIAEENTDPWGEKLEGTVIYRPSGNKKQIEFKPKKRAEIPGYIDSTIKSKVCDKFDGVIQDIAGKDMFYLVKAMMVVESKCIPQAVNLAEKGEPSYGIMQTKLSTCAEVGLLPGVYGMQSAKAGITCGTRYLRRLQSHYKFKEEAQMIRAYNMGPTAAGKKTTSPEENEYVQKVMYAQQQLQK